MDRGVEPARPALECIPLRVGPCRMIADFDATDPAHGARNGLIGIRAPQRDRSQRFPQPFWCECRCHF
jgi:hypothetical protein